MATIHIRKETREERNDVFSFFTTKKALNENDEIIEVEEPIKENTTLNQLQDEETALHAQIAEIEKKLEDNDEMRTMIINFVE